MNELITKVPFQFKVLSIIATDQAETSGKVTYISSPGTHTKDITYNILSRQAIDAMADKPSPFKTLSIHNGYFVAFDDNIISDNGLIFKKDGNYIIESNFKIKLKRNQAVDNILLRYIFTQKKNQYHVDSKHTKNMVMNM